MKTDQVALKQAAELDRRHPDGVPDDGDVATLWQCERILRHRLIMAHFLTAQFY